jgi:hypothetical protein
MAPHRISWQKQKHNDMIYAKWVAYIFAAAADRGLSTQQLMLLYADTYAKWVASIFAEAADGSLSPQYLPLLYPRSQLHDGVLPCTNFQR